MLTLRNKPNYLHDMTTIDGEPTVWIDSVPPPVPTAERVRGDGDSLRVEYDDVVEFTHLIVSCIARKYITDSMSVDTIHHW